MTRTTFYTRWISVSFHERRMHNGELISIRELRVELRQGNTRFALTIPRFKASQGEFLSVVGPSGCGKSTFLDVLGLLLSPRSAVEFTMSFPDIGAFDLRGPHRDDRVLSRLRRRHLGYVLQSGGLLPFLTVAENISLPLNLAGLAGDAAPLARTLGIHDQLAKKPEALSGGQRQRTAIARALIHKPDIILADEPTAAVDHASAETILSLFRSLANRQGTTVILATHDTALAEVVADRIIRMAPNTEETGSTLQTPESRGRGLQ